MKACSVKPSRRRKWGQTRKRGPAELTPRYGALPAPIRRAPKLTTSVVADLPGWGPVWVIRANDIPGAKRRFLVGSNPNWGRNTIERLYGHRWKLETTFRDGTQLLSLKDCQCHNFQAQQNHFALVLMAYAFLQSQKVRQETSCAVIKRLVSVAVEIPELIPTAKVRPIKPERRRRRRDALYATASDPAA